MIVRAVDVHQPFPDGGERGEGGRRAVDELTVRTRAGEGALEDELVFFARFEAVFIQKSFQRRFQFSHVEQGLDRATVAAAADERAVGTFAQHEVQCADDDGLARASLAGDDVAARLKFQREIGDDGEVFNAQRGQHGQISATDKHRWTQMQKRKYFDPRKSRSDDGK